jgi:hypothetical protein
MLPIEPERLADMQKIGNYAINLSTLIRPGKTIAVNVTTGNILLPGQLSNVDCVLVISRPHPFLHIGTHHKGITDEPK